MSWLKVDDGFNTHPKVCRLDEEFAPQVAMNARAVWLTVGVYCAHSRSPFVEVAPLRKLLPCSRAELDEAVRVLVAVGLIDETDAGLEVHDWGHYVPPSSTERVKEHRDRKKAKHSETVTCVSETVTRATGNTETLPLPSPPDPSRPDPTPPLDSSQSSESCHVRGERDAEDSEDSQKEPTSKRGRERRATAKRIFAFWKSELGHDLALDTLDKLQKIEARLREYERGHDPENPETDPEFICRTAIVGIGMNPFNRGENPRGKRYDSIGLIFRNNEKTDEYFRDGIDEMRRREKAERAKALAAVPQDMPLPAPHVPQERREQVARYVRSSECIESFYGAQARSGAERIEMLQKHVEAYPDDTEAQMVLMLSGAVGVSGAA